MSNITEIAKYFEQYGSNETALRACLANHATISKIWIQDYMNIGDELGREVISKLLRNGMIEEITPGIYVKTQEFISWLTEDR
jgi:hypothetical protein